MVDLQTSRTAALNQIVNIALRTARAQVDAVVMQATGGQVQSGPFRGAILTSMVSWGSGDLAPKSLGCYEAELHNALEAAIARKPERVVNVGCAEGYYANGLARRLPGVPCFAYDIDAAAQNACRDMASRNGIAEQVTVGGLCTPDMLADHVAGRQTLVVMDVEGAELDLLPAEKLAAFRTAQIFVECHDFTGKPITETLSDRFAASHDVTRIEEGPRDPNRFSTLRRMNSFERWLAVCEFRPCTMNWLVLTPR